MLYQELYHIMFNAATDAVRDIDLGNPAAARARLVRAQQQAEEKYLEETEEDSSSGACAPPSLSTGTMR